MRSNKGRISSPITEINRTSECDFKVFKNYIGSKRSNQSHKERTSHFEKRVSRHEKQSTRSRSKKIFIEATN